MIQSAMALRTVSIQSPSLAEVVDEGLEKVQKKNNVGQKLHNSTAFHAVLLAPPGEWYNFLTSTSPCFTGFETL